KKKKPKLLNKFDKTIKAELDAAEKLRKRKSSVTFPDALAHVYRVTWAALHSRATVEEDDRQDL
ncbi:hypothetical protein U0070_020609, partial [Myodes glareolus]